MYTSNAVLKWLLEFDNPSIRFRTLVELLSYSPNDPVVDECRKLLVESAPVKTLLGKMHPDGYWLQKTTAKFWLEGTQATSKLIGDGTEYGSFGTTHYCLSYLAELGIDRSNSQLAKAADRYLNLQKDDGDFYRHFSCLLGLNIKTFTMLGYGDDPRLRKSIQLLLDTERPDDGYLCDMHEGKYKNRATKSCIRGSVKALLAFSYHPELWGHERVKRLANYFLMRGGIFKSLNPDELVNKDMERISFPITWRSNVFEILLALSRMGYGKQPELDRAWQMLDLKADKGGRYLLDWTPSQSPWKVGGRNQPNKWITFYVNLAHHYNRG